jgi:hypothetical protein
MPHLCLVKQLSIYMETPGQGGHYRAKARSLRLCEKRLTRVNLEYTECAREIMALEEKYPIVSSRKVSALPRPGPSSRPATAASVSCASSHNPNPNAKSGAAVAQGGDLGDPRHSRRAEVTIVSRRHASGSAAVDHHSWHSGLVTEPAGTWSLAARRSRRARTCRANHPRYLNDAPCPPCTSHGASTRRPFGAGTRWACQRS